MGASCGENQQMMMMMMMMALRLRACLTTISGRRTNLQVGRAPGPGSARLVYGVGSEARRKEEDGKGGPRQRTSSDHARRVAWVCFPSSNLFSRPFDSRMESGKKETLGGNLSHTCKAAADCSIHTSLVAHLRRSGKHDMTCSQSACYFCMYAAETRPLKATVRTVLAICLPQ